jgi:hypothetical protein
MMPVDEYQALVRADAQEAAKRSLQIHAKSTLARS